MKKILFAIVALFAMLFSSCSNDDIDVSVSTVVKKYNLTLNIRTQGLYDEFNITPGMANLIRGNYSSLGVTSFIYNEAGDFVDKKESTQKTLNVITQDFGELEEGKYTVVTIQTLVKDQTGKPSNITYENPQKLSTLQIKQNANILYDGNVVGVCTTEIHLNNAENITVTPKAIGSLLTIFFGNFDKTDYASVGFGTDDILDYYKLDPALSRDDKFYLNLTEKGSFRARLITDDLSEDRIMKTVYLIESSITFRYGIQKSQHVGTNTWILIGDRKISKLEDGKHYYGAFIYKGDENFMSMPYLTESYDECFNWFNKNASYDNTPSDDPNTSVIPNICTDWKGTVSSVQTFMNDYEMILGEKGKAALLDDGTYAIAYKGKEKEKMIAYTFESKKKGMYRADVFYESANVKFNDLKNALDTDYKYVDKNESFYMYLSADEKTVVALFIPKDDDKTYSIAFFDYDFIIKDSKNYTKKMINKRLILPLNSNM